MTDTPTDAGRGSQSARASVEPRLFYFSRNCGPNPFATKWLVSGVIEAADLQDAQARIDAVLAKAKTIDSHRCFNFADLANTPRSESNIVAITMGERH